MTSFQLMFISSFSVLIPLFFIIIKNKGIDRSFYPFLVLIFLNLINETIVWIIMMKYYFDVRKYIFDIEYVYDVYFLLEAFIIAWQFFRWGLFKSMKWIVYPIQFSFLIIWLFTSFYFNDGGRLNSYFIIYYSFVILLMSLIKLNQIIRIEFSNIVLNPVFIICSTFLFFFVYTIITELLSLYPTSNTSFRWNILNLLNIVTIICNIAYGVAIFQMRKRERVYLSSL